MKTARAVLSFVLFLSFFLITLSAPDIHAADHTLASRPWMGITVRDAQTGDGNKGVVVADVIKGGPAEAAGISASDVITGINGREVYGVADFVTELQHLGVGEPVVVEVNSDGTVRTVDVMLGRRPAGLFSHRGGYAAGMGGGTMYTGGWPEGCDGGGHYMSGFGMSGGLKYGKMYFVRMFPMLGLDPEQTRKAGELENAYMKSSIKLEAGIRLAEVELEELSLSEKVDLKKVRAKIDEIAGKRAELRFMRYRSLEELRGVLTPAQRQRMDKIRMMEGAGGYGYGHGPMGSEVYGARGCDGTGGGGPLIMDVPAQ